MSWRSVKLGDTCDVIAGGTPKRSKPSYWSGDIPWVKISDMIEGRIRQTEETITRAGLEGSSAKLLPPGTLLVSIFATIGRTAVLECEAATNQAIVGVIPKQQGQFDDRFLQYSLRRKTQELQRQGRGVAQANISGSMLKATELLVPPLAEQKRIARILDSADALRAKRREALAQLDTLTQSTFLDMFGDPIRSGWKMVSVEAVASSHSGAIRTGPFGSQLLHSEFVDEGIRVLGIDNAVANEFRDGEPRFITAQKYEQLRRYTVRPRDVLITIMGTCGRCAVVPDDICTAINTKHLCCITLDRRRCLPEFMHAYFLGHPIARGHLERSAKGAIMSGLNMRIIKELPIPAAPIDLQHRFAAIVQSVEQQKVRQRAHLAELDTLFASLQSRAFRGGL